MGYDELIKRKASINSDFDSTLKSIDEEISEIKRVENIASNTKMILDDLDREFCEKTKLTATDSIFLFLATGLQIARQYLLSNNQFRLDSKQGDGLVKSLVPPSWQDVLLQSVPYDAIKTSSHVTATGISGTTHRYRTLGHDPILGWIFGTANIMTNSLTKYNLETYQVSNMIIQRHYPLGVVGMLEKTVEYGKNDPILLGAAVVRQAVHFGSDYFTKQGLPVPIISTVNNQLAGDMISKWHIDMYSITRGAAVSILINQLISCVHSLFYDGITESDRKLYEVRTRKILSYSNLIASGTNIAVTAITRDFSKLDIGGLAVTIYRLISDAKFIREVKEEFIFGSYRDMIMGE